MYPFLVSLGLLPSKLRLHPVGYELLALLPHLLQRKHPGISDEKAADLKRELIWGAINNVLGELDVTNVSELGYTCVSCALVLLCLVLY